MGFPPNSKQRIWNLSVGYLEGGLGFDFQSRQTAATGIQVAPVQKEKDNHQTIIEKNNQVAPTTKKKNRLVYLIFAVTTNFASKNVPNYFLENIQSISLLHLVQFSLGYLLMRQQNFNCKKACFIFLVNLHVFVIIRHARHYICVILFLYVKNNFYCCF